MAPSVLKKRKLDEGFTSHTSRKTKKPRPKHSHYSSSSPTPSADEFAPVDLADSEPEPDVDSDAPSTSVPSRLAPTESEPASDSETSASNSDASVDSNPNRTTLKPRKRNDPTAFSASISAILNSKLSTSKRRDPVLARSATAQQASEALSDQRLETKARRQLLADKKLALEKGRVKDVLLGTDAATGEGGAGELQEQEKRLRKTAQRGVVKLFNAVRQAQVRGEEAARNAKGIAGRDRREEKVNEMSKEGFLELVAGGGSAAKGMEKVVEEA